MDAQNWSMQVGWEASIDCQAQRRGALGGGNCTWMELESDVGVEDMSLMRTVTRKEDNGRGCGRRADMRLKVRDGSQGWDEMGI